MALIDTLLAAVVRADGDGLVMHVGDRPCVVGPSGPVHLSSSPLTVQAMSSILDQLLPAESRRALMELGAIEYELAASEMSEVAPDERFTMVAARGGDDIWIELRRQRMGAPDVERAAEPGPHELRSVASPPVALTPEMDMPLPLPARPARHTPRPDGQPAVVLPLARSPIRPEPPRHITTSLPKHAGLDRLLRIAAARGASTLYIMAQARPSIRIDDDVAALDGEPPLTQAEVEALILDLAPSANRETLLGSTSAEWMCDLPDVGRVRCVSFRDHRGPGGVFRLIPARLISADQLGLSREIQALCSEPEGLVLVSGPRLSGKSTLISAFVDLINRTRADYVITIESEIKFVHESRNGMVSQREVRGDADQMLALAKAALRENPDVLVIDDLRSPEIVSFALEAADSGHLVIGSVTAHTNMAAIARIIDQTPADRQAHVALALSETLRGGVAQVLLRKAGGGRVAARELLLTTPSVASLIAEGKISQLPLAIDSGRKYGMVPMNDALVAFVQSGAVEAREAYRKAFDRQALLDSLKREGIDTSFVERLA